jgi:hypothetical protein
MEQGATFRKLCGASSEAGLPPNVPDGVRLSIAREKKAFTKKPAGFFLLDEWPAMRTLTPK